MIAVVWLLATALAVAGSQFEATDGQNVTIHFDIDEVEKADLLRIIFKGDYEGKRLIAQRPWRYDDPPPPGISLKVGEGRVSVTIQEVNSSRSGLYEALAGFGKDVSLVNATLVVNKAPFPTSPAPEHPPTPKPPNLDLFWLLVIPLVIIVISGVVYFWRCRRMPRFQREKSETGADCPKENGVSLLPDNAVLKSSQLYL